MVRRGLRSRGGVRQVYHRASAMEHSELWERYALDEPEWPDCDAPLPLLVQGDTLNLRIFLLTRVSGFPVASPPFTQASLAGLTLNLALGDKVGNATNYYSTLFNVAPDATNSFFSGALALNTAAI